MRCWKGFATAELLEMHCGAIEVCKPSARVLPEEGDPEDGINAQVEERVNRRGGKDKIQTWTELFCVLFPNDFPPPSPCKYTLTRCSFENTG